MRGSLILNLRTKMNLDQPFWLIQLPLPQQHLHQGSEWRLFFGPVVLVPSLEPLTCTRSSYREGILRGGYRSWLNKSAFRQSDLFYKYGSREIRAKKSGQDMHTNMITDWSVDNSLSNKSIKNLVPRARCLEALENFWHFQNFVRVHLVLFI